MFHDDTKSIQIHRLAEYKIGSKKVMTHIVCVVGLVILSHFIRKRNHVLNLKDKERRHIYVYSYPPNESEIWFIR